MNPYFIESKELYMKVEHLINTPKSIGEMMDERLEELYGSGNYCKTAGQIMDERLEELYGNVSEEKTNPKGEIFDVQLKENEIISERFSEITEVSELVCDPDNFDEIFKFEI